MKCPTCVCQVECCRTPVSIPNEEFNKLLNGIKNHPKNCILNIVNGNVMFYNNERDCCGFLDEKNRCMIYDKRPNSCKEFGESKDCMFLEFCERIKENKKEFVKYMKEEM